MEEDFLLLKPNSRVCARHFPGGGVTKDPQANLGKRFTSPIKKKLPRAKRVRRRDNTKSLTDLMSASTDVTNSTIIEEEPRDEQQEDEQSTFNYFGRSPAVY